MTTVGLKCLLEELIDEQPALTGKQIANIKTDNESAKSFVVITFDNGDVIKRPLYEWSA